jgi:hypothetical protein
MLQPRSRLVRGVGVKKLAAVSVIHTNSSRRSFALCHRSGSFTRHFRTTRSRTGGVKSCSVESGGGSRSRMAAITLPWLFPSNARFPVTIS